MEQKRTVLTLVLSLFAFTAVILADSTTSQSYEPEWKDPAAWKSDGMWEVTKSDAGLKFLKDKTPAHNSMCWLKLKRSLKQGQTVQVTFRMEVPYKHIDLCMGTDSYQEHYGRDLPRFEEILTLGNRPETGWVTLDHTITSTEPINTLAFLCWGWRQDRNTYMEVQKITVLPPDEDPGWFEWRVRPHLNQRTIPERVALQDWFPFGVYISLGSMHGVAKREGKEGLWDLMDDVFSDCKAAGMNTVWLVNTSTANFDELASLCKKYDLKMNPQPGQFNVKFAAVANVLKAMKQYIPKYAGIGIISGWGAGEEFPVAKVSRLKQVHELVRDLDPDNALVTIHNKTQCYEIAGKTLDIRMACRDIYPFFGSVKVGPTTFETSMNYFEDTIDKNQRWLPRGASLWVMPQGQGERGPRGVGGYIRTPSVEEVRVQAWSALSRGAKGLGYFVYHSSGTSEKMGFDGLRALDGSHTPRMKELSRLAAKILPQAKIITSWRRSRVVAETNNRRVRAYLFRGPKNEAYALVYNRTVSYYSHLDVRIPFQTGETVTDLVNEKDSDAHITNGVSTFSVALERGSGTIIKLNAQLPAEP